MKMERERKRHKLMTGMKPVRPVNFGPRQSIVSQIGCQQPDISAEPGGTVQDSLGDPGIAQRRQG